MENVRKENSGEQTSAQDQQNWITEQEKLRENLIDVDDFPWKLPRDGVEEGEAEMHCLRYVGGVDISFSKEDSSIACGTVVVLELKTLQVVYEDFSLVTLPIPYVPGFLAFREAPVLLELLEKMKRNNHSTYPQLLMVDGNGILHPRGNIAFDMNQGTSAGFGLACHLGVTANLPTLGIGKKLHPVDGLTHARVKELVEAKEHSAEDFISLIGSSGRTWGVAMRSTEGSVKPIFISVGHRVSLHTAIAIVKLTCKYRIPEPIRQADIKSREFLRNRKERNSEGICGAELNKEGLPAISIDNGVAG